MSRNSLALDSVLDIHEADLTALILGQRDDLPKAANNQPMAPSSSYAANVLRDMRQGRARPVKMLLSVFRTNLIDGVLPRVVRKTTSRLDAIVSVYANPLAGCSRPLAALNRHDMRAECAENIQQLAVEANPNDPDALRGLIDACDADAAVTNDLRRWAELRLARVLMEQAGAVFPSDPSKVTRGHLVLT